MLSRRGTIDVGIRTFSCQCWSKILIYIPSVMFEGFKVLVKYQEVLHNLELLIVDDFHIIGREKAIIA